MHPTETTVEVVKIKAFLKSIGIGLIPKTLPDSTFLPGLDLGPGFIYVDFEKLLYPGDLLHEAGHIAVTAPDQRKLIGSGKMPGEWPEHGDEITAMLWSFAAATHLDLPLEFVFHPNGYKGDSGWLIDNYRSNTFTGLPLLEWFGMTLSEKSAAEKNVPAFPSMLRWLRE